MLYAGFWRRLIAFIIDIIPITAAVFAVAYLFLGADEVFRSYFESDRSTRSRIEFLEARNQIRDTSLVLWILYGLVMDCSPLQGTHGKRLLGLRVVDRQGGRLTFGRSSRRMAMKLVGAVPLFLGYIWAGFRPDKAGWHDLVAGSRVIEHVPE